MMKTQCSTANIGRKRFVNGIVKKYVIQECHFPQVSAYLKSDPILGMMPSGFKRDNIKEAFFGLLWYDPSNFLGFPIPLEDRVLEKPGFSLENADETLRHVEKAGTISLNLPPEGRLLSVKQLPIGVNRGLSKLLERYVKEGMTFMIEAASHGGQVVSSALEEEVVTALRLHVHESLIPRACDFATNLGTEFANDEFRLSTLTEQGARLEAEIDDFGGDEEVGGEFSDEMSGDEDDDRVFEGRSGQPMGGGKAMRKRLGELERVQKTILKKWQYSDVGPQGYRSWRTPGKEFMATLVNLLKVDARLTEDFKLLSHKLARVVAADESSSFSAETWTPNYVALTVSSVVCQGCQVPDDLDVVSRHVDGAGEWVCEACT